MSIVSSLYNNEPMPLPAPSRTVEELLDQAAHDFGADAPLTPGASHAPDNSVFIARLPAPTTARPMPAPSSGPGAQPYYFDPSKPIGPGDELRPSLPPVAIAGLAVLALLMLGGGR